MTRNLNMDKEKSFNNLMEKIVSLAKRRGFIYPDSEIYGGMSGFWDFGPLGVELKNNIKKEWAGFQRFDAGKSLGGKRACGDF